MEAMSSSSVDAGTPLHGSERAAPTHLPRRRRRAAAAAAGLCAAALGAAALRSRPRGLAASLAADASAIHDSRFPLNNVSVYKRTSMSTNGKEECAWWESWSHAEYALSVSNTNFTIRDVARAADQDTCADRCSIVATNYNLHDVEEHRSLHGPISAAEWIAAWNVQHGVFDAGWAWNEWMANALTFWVPRLDTNVENLRVHGVSFLGRSYANPVDGRETYAVYFVNPFTGGVIELHSADCTRCADFKGYEANECPEAATLHWSTAELDDVALWGREDVLGPPGDDDDDFVLYYNETWNLVRISFPATRVEEIYKLRQVFGLDVDPVVKAPSKDCSFSNARLNASTGVDGAPAAGNASTPLELQFVDNRAAAHGNLTVKMFETYVAQLHGKLMGEDSGWDRFVDNHVGLYVGDYVALDAWKATLDAAGVPYMPHVAGSFTDDAPQADQVVAGSIWTAGIGGLAIELNGYFDFSEFTNASAFFFCHPT